MTAVSFARAGWGAPGLGIGEISSEIVYSSIRNNAGFITSQFNNEVVLSHMNEDEHRAVIAAWMR
jgi:hypothetical protein